jgi:hypothetical protein
MYKHYSKKAKLHAIALYAKAMAQRLFQNRQGISLACVKRIFNCYLQFGISGLEKRVYSHHYTPEFKESVMREVLENAYPASRPL